MGQKQYPDIKREYIMWTPLHCGWSRIRVFDVLVSGICSASSSPTRRITQAAGHRGGGNITGRRQDVRGDRRSAHVYGKNSQSAGAICAGGMMLATLGEQQARTRLKRPSCK
jgi:hypothetical protein